MYVYDPKLFLLYWRDPETLSGWGVARCDRLHTDPRAHRVIDGLEFV